MCQTYRQRWYRTCTEKREVERRNVTNDWLFFQEWTLSLIKNASSLTMAIAKEKENIHQRKDEDPREFHARLDTLEQYFERASEKERARSFFVKLQHSLQLRIQDHVRELPETREEVVNTANHYWDLMKTNSDRGNTNETKPNHLRKRKAPPDEPQGPEKKTYKNRQNNRRRQESSTNNNLNPIGRDGKRNVCHICGSDTHYSPDCPDRKDPKEKPKVQIATTAGNDSETE